jgi:Retrotransposon gag protein
MSEKRSFLEQLGDKFSSSTGRKSKRLQGRDPSPFEGPFGDAGPSTNKGRPLRLSFPNFQDFGDPLNDTFVDSPNPNQSQLDYLDNTVGDKSTLFDKELEDFDKDLDQRIADFKRNKMANPPVVVNRVPNSVLDPGKFSNLPSENIHSFLGRFDTVARANGWSNDTKCAYLPCTFDGTAKTWYLEYEQKMSGAGNQITWPVLRAAILNFFNSKAYIELANAKLAVRLQGDDEPFTNYYYDVLQYCQTIDAGMPEEQKVGHIIRGLKAPLLEKLYPLDLKTTSEVFQKAIGHEAARYALTRRTLLETLFQDSNGINNKASTPVPIPAPRVIAPVAAIAGTSNDTVDLLKELTNEIKALRLSREQPYQPLRSRGRGRTDTGRPICYVCNRVGHTSYSCYERPNGQQSNRGNAWRGGRGYYNREYNSQSSTNTNNGNVRTEASTSNQGNGQN